MRASASAWLVLFAVALAGCSVLSDTASGVPDPEPGGGDAGGGGMDAAIPGEDSGAMPAEDAHLPGDPDSGPVVRDSGPVVPDAGPPPVDSGPVRPTRAVQCGEERCMGVEACCATSDERHCIESAMGDCRCDTWGCETTVVACDGPSDCPATHVCCASRGITEDHAERFSCQESCEHDTLTRRVEVCQDGDGLSCRNGADCGPVFWLPDGFQGCEG